MGYEDKRPQRNEGPRGDKPYSGDRRGGSRGDRPYGDKPYGGKPRGGKPYGSKPYGGKPYGDGPRGGKPYGDRPYGDKPRGERFGGRDDRRDGKPYGDGRRNDRGFGRPYGDSPRGDKPYGGKPRDGRFGDRGDRGFDKPRGERNFDKPRGDRPRDGKPYGDRSRGGDKPGYRSERRGGAMPFNERGKNGPRRQREPRVGTAGILKNEFIRMDRRSYPSYKDLYGKWTFDGFELSVDHVQGDPYALPSKMTVRVEGEIAGFPAELYDQPWKLTALEDAIVRRFGQSLTQHQKRSASEDGKVGGTISVSRPGPEILKRSACVLSDEMLEMHFEVSLPAMNRLIMGEDVSEMLIEVLPRCVRESLLYVSYEPEALQAVVDLADDQHALREEVAKRDLVCFVADGAILPRESGTSSAPMQDAVAFESPESLRVSIDLPHAGTVTGMGVSRGVTLVIGGGYHGKTTLLKAIEAGVYDHVAGDGRELVVCDETAMKLRSEDGRSVRDVNISLFIDNLPNGADTQHFWSDDASGSTSQAAATVEAIEAGSTVFLIDEDTSATNFMVRDEVMQAVVSSEGEPITPFVERLRDLYEKTGISTILVVGSSGAFFPVADTVVQMQDYKPVDMTEAVKSLCVERGLEVARPRAAFAKPSYDRHLVTPPHPLTRKTAADAKKEQVARREGRAPLVPERVKVKVFSGIEVVVGTIGSDMRYVDQLVDAEQTRTLAHIVRWSLEGDLFARSTVAQIVAAAMAQIEEGGLCSICDSKGDECGYAMPRKQEIFACLNRLRPRDRR